MIALNSAATFPTLRQKGKTDSEKKIYISINYFNYYFKIFRPNTSQSCSNSSNLDNTKILCHIDIGKPCSHNLTAKAGLLIALTTHSILEGISIGVQTKFDEVIIITSKNIIKYKTINHLYEKNFIYANNSYFLDFFSFGKCNTPQSCTIILSRFRIEFHQC